MVLREAIFSNITEIVKRFTTGMRFRVFPNSFSFSYIPSYVYRVRGSRKCTANIVEKYDRSLVLG